MPVWQCFYHLETATKYRQLLITPELEPVLFRYMKSKAFDLKGTVFAINGALDHVHLVVSFPPSLAISAFIGQVKGFSASQIHPQFSEFGWQEEYGVFTFDQKRLPPCVAYVERQKEHHQQNTLIPILERCYKDDGHIAEEPADYAVSSPHWPFPD